MLQRVVVSYNGPSPESAAVGASSSSSAPFVPVGGGPWSVTAARANRSLGATLLQLALCSSDDSKLFGRAGAAFRIAYLAYAHVLGQEHTETLIAQRDLGVAMLNADPDNIREARERLRSAYYGLKEARGDEDTETISAKAWLALAVVRALGASGCEWVSLLPAHPLLPAPRFPAGNIAEFSQRARARLRPGTTLALSLCSVALCLCASHAVNTSAATLHLRLVNSHAPFLADSRKRAGWYPTPSALPETPSGSKAACSCRRA